DLIRAEARTGTKNHRRQEYTCPRIPRAPAGGFHSVVTANTLTNTMPARRALGCLSRVLATLALIAVLGLALGAAAAALFTPWSFYLGGRLHLSPGWQGIRTMQPGGRYCVVFLAMSTQPTR